MATETAFTEMFESLPYYDDDLQKYPELKEKVDREMARELNQPTSLHPNVPPPIELFSVREHIYLRTCIPNILTALNFFG
jgi:pre-mRNA-splicing factor SPF27